MNSLLVYKIPLSPLPFPAPLFGGARLTSHPFHQRREKSRFKGHFRPELSLMPADNSFFPTRRKEVFCVRQGLGAARLISQ